MSRSRRPNFLLEILLPSVLGGVIVFGSYFFLIPDSWKPGHKPPQPSKPATAKPSPAKVLPAIKPPSPETVSENSPEALEPELPVTVEPPEVNSPGSIDLPAQDREILAEQALTLARKMSQQNQSKAAKWFQKVIDDHPQSAAARTAAEWLAMHATSER